MNHHDTFDKNLIWVYNIIVCSHIFAAENLYILTKVDILF